ncbi:MAG: hypothetical protein J6U54_12630 [Clostridiales bacterium]|nr:hypothetical protein [Clostridiales bacterium]
MKITNVEKKVSYGYASNDFVFINEKWGSVDIGDGTPIDCPYCSEEIRPSVSVIFTATGVRGELDTEEKKYRVNFVDILGDTVIDPVIKSYEIPEKLKEDNINTVIPPHFMTYKRLNTDDQCQVYDALKDAGIDIHEEMDIARDLGQLNTAMDKLTNFELYKREGLGDQAMAEVYGCSIEDLRDMKAVYRGHEKILKAKLCYILGVNKGMSTAEIARMFNISEASVQMYVGKYAKELEELANE